MPRQHVSHRVMRTIFATLLGCAMLFVPHTASAIEVPPTTAPTYIQTNGPNSALGLGDWYTNAANGVGSGYHYFEFTVPCGWPAALAINVDLFSPEMNSNNLPSDEVNNAPDNTVFELYSPGTVIGPAPNVPGPGAAGSIAAVTYIPSSAAEQWVRFHTLAAPVTCGTYVLRAETTGDDQNAWRLRVGWDNDNDPNNTPPANNDNPDGIIGTIDELVLGVQTTSYQNNVAAPGIGQCLTLYEYVTPGVPSVAFHNFDMDTDPNARIRYYAPSDVYDPTATTGGVLGSLSANQVWNGGTSTTRGTGDIVNNPESGWWKIVTCIPNNNQYIQEGQNGIPAYYVQPPTPQMTLSKSDGVTQTTPGAIQTYTLSFANTASGPSAGAAFQVVLHDTIPTNTTYQSCTINAPYTGTCTFAAGIVTFNLNEPVNAGDSGSVVVTVQVNAGATNTVVNTASLDYEDMLGNPYPPATATDIDVLPPDLTIIKLANATTTDPDQVVGFTLNYQNVGFSAATNVVINEIVPLNTTFVAASSSAGWSCADNSPAGTSCTLAVGTLAIGASGSATFAVRVVSQPATGTTQIVNTASISDDGTHGSDPTPGNNTSSASVPLTPTAISLVSLGASRSAQGVTIAWTTSAEFNTLGFHIYRSADRNQAHAVRVSPVLISAKSQNGGGASYQWVDSGQTGAVFYWLVEVERSGTATFYGPAATATKQQASTTILLPLVMQ